MVRSRSRGRKPAKQVEGQEQVKGKGGLLALHSQGKQAYRRRGKHKHHVALPPLVPSICELCVPRALSLHFPLPSLPPTCPSPTRAEVQDSFHSPDQVGLLR